MHVWLTAAFPEEVRNLRDLAAFRYSQCSRQGSMEAPTSWIKLEECLLVLLDERWKGKRWGSHSSGESHD